MKSWWGKDTGMWMFFSEHSVAVLMILWRDSGGRCGKTVQFNRQEFAVVSSVGEATPTVGASADWT